MWGWPASLWRKSLRFTTRMQSCCVNRVGETVLSLEFPALPALANFSRCNLFALWNCWPQSSVIQIHPELIHHCGHRLRLWTTLQKPDSKVAEAIRQWSNSSKVLEELSEDAKKQLLEEVQEATWSTENWYFDNSQKSYLQCLSSYEAFEFYFEDIGVPGVQTNVKSQQLSRCYATLSRSYSNETGLLRIWHATWPAFGNVQNSMTSTTTTESRSLEWCCIDALLLHIVAFAL